MKLDLRTGSPYWPIRDGIPYSYPALDRDSVADVLVIGAGMTGAAVARELTTAGLDTVVVDRRDVASGSSAASTGILLYDTDTSLADLARIVGPQRAGRVYRLGARAIDEIDAFCASRQQRCGFARRPGVYVASKASHVRQLRDEYERRRQIGFDVRWLEASELAGRFGFSFPGAIYSSDCGQVDPYRLTHELLAAATDAGARVFDRTEVVRLVRQRDGRLRVTTNRGASITVASVVWATGYEAYHHAPAKAKFASTWAIVTEPVPDLSATTEPFLLWETARPYLYARDTDDQRLMIGGEDEFCRDCHRNARWFRTKTAKLLRKADRLFPGLRLEIAYAWAGTFSITTDGLPFVGRTRPDANVWLALGYGGNGITFSMMAARFLRSALMGQSDADVEIFSRR